LGLLNGLGIAVPEPDDLEGSNCEKADGATPIKKMKKIICFMV
jgi:hypothetical protein